MKKSFLTLSVLCVTLFIYGMSKPIDNPDASINKSTKHTSHYVKPHAGIQLNYNRPKVMQVGDTAELKLKFKSKLQADTLEVNISHDEGLQLLSESHFQFDKVKGAANKIVLQILANNEGQFYIDVTATIITNGNSQVRTFSIPVTVGDQSNAKTTSGSSTSTGYKALPSQGVISMPATETTD